MNIDFNLVSTLALCYSLNNPLVEIYILVPTVQIVGII